jgi:hypothetical protein
MALMLSLFATRQIHHQPNAIPQPKGVARVLPESIQVRPVRQTAFWNAKPRAPRFAQRHVKNWRLDSQPSQKSHLERQNS